MNERWLTVADLAEHLQVGEATIRRHVNNGDWPHWRDGRITRFNAEHIRRIGELHHREPRPRKRRRT